MQESERTFARRNSLVGFARKHLFSVTVFSKAPQTLTCSERRARLSPFEDLRDRTLSRIRGLWAKFAYMAELRDSDGNYQHWGHGRVHGHENSQHACAQAHSELYLSILRTPLWRLMQEDSPTAYASKNWEAAEKRLLPADLRGGSQKHFSSVALALRLLSARQLSSNRSGA